MGLGDDAKTGGNHLKSEDIENNGTYWRQAGFFPVGF